MKVYAFAQLIFFIFISCQKNVPGGANSSDSNSKKNGSDSSNLQGSQIEEIAKTFSKVEEKKLENQKNTFFYEMVSSTDKILVRFKKKNGEILKRLEFIETLGNDSEEGKSLREILTTSIASIFKTGDFILLKSPLLSENTKEKNFYFEANFKKFKASIQDHFKDYTFYCNPSLENATEKSDEKKLKYRFTAGFYNAQFVQQDKEKTEKLASGAVSFLSKSSTKERPVHLVAPCPFESKLDNKNESLLHLKAYMEKIQNDEKRQESFWRLASYEAIEVYRSKKTLYFNTHGTGVAYLHMRLETEVYGEKPNEDLYPLVFK